MYIRRKVSRPRKRISLKRRLRFKMLLSRLKTEGRRELVREGKRVARNAARQQIRRATGFYF